MNFKKNPASNCLLILFSFTLFSCPVLSSPDEEILPPEAMAKAKAFFEAVVNENFITAYKYTNGTLKWRGPGASDNKVIDTEKEFVRVAPLIFNETFVNEVKDQAEIKIGCCLSSFYVWYNSNEEIVFWFNDDGTPYVLVNDSIVDPSFDCTQAREVGEKTICQSPRLAKQDNILATEYKKAKVFLTDIAYRSLKSEQIKFIKSRNTCGRNQACIFKVTKNRILEIRDLIHAEKTKHNDSNLNEQLSGTWRSSGFKSAAYCGKQTDEEINSNSKIKVIIDLNSREVEFRDQKRPSKRSCSINRIIETTFAKVYFNTAYTNNYWGSCGGDIFQLPFSGNYTALELVNSNINKSECGVLVFSGHSGADSSLLYSSEYRDGLLVDSGFVLVKEE